MGNLEHEWLSSGSAGSGAVLLASLDTRHVLTPLHAQTACRQASDALLSCLPSPPRRLLLDLPGEGFALTSSDTQSLVEAASRLMQRQADASPERALRFRFGVHALANEESPQTDELMTAKRVAAASPFGTLSLSAAAVDQLTQPWLLPLRDDSRHQDETEQGPHLFSLNAAAPTKVPAYSDLGATLAVLPPEFSGSTHARAAAVADMVLDALIVSLSRSSQLHVLSARSSQSLRHSREILSDAFDHLGAQYVLRCGGTLGVNGRVFLQLALHSQRQQTAVWQERAEFELVDLLYADVFPLSQACEDIHTVLQARSMQAARRHAWGKLEHFQLLNAATQMMHKLLPASFEQSRLMLQYLQQQLPRHPEPLVWLAQWHLLEIAQGARAAKVAPTILNLCHQALEFDQHHSLAHALAGHAQSMLAQAWGPQSMDLSAAHHQRALATNPSNSLALVFYALHQTYRGQTQFACESAKLALALSPLDPWRHFIDSVCAHALLANRQAEAAILHAQNAMRLNACHGPTLICLAIAHARLGHEPQAKKAVERLLQLWPDYTVGEFRVGYWGRGTTHADEFASALQQAGLAEA